MTCIAGKKKGGVWCVGDGRGGLLGPDELNVVKEPVQVGHLAKARAASYLGRPTPARSPTRGPSVGVRGLDGQLGTGQADSSLEPVAVKAQICVGCGAAPHVRRRWWPALLWANAAVRWAKARAVALSPVEVAGPSAVSQLSLGEGHTCALGKGGQVWCWGSGGSGAAWGRAPELLRRAYTGRGSTSLSA